MCDVPRRNWRNAFHPKRLIIALVALAVMVGGWQIPNAFGLIPVALGAAALLMAILLPAVHDVEFGFPSGVKVSAALQNRQEQLRAAFEEQKADLALCANLICDDPATATQLLEAAWAKTSADWRGPVTAGIRSYTLCVFVHRFISHTQWAHPQQQVSAQGSQAAPLLSPLAALDPTERVIVVLHEFGELSLAEIAGVTGSPLAQVMDSLAHAEASVARLHADGAL